MDDIRTGIGYDLHPLVPVRKLVLGGVEIPFQRGLDGWSDADCLTHAVMDALLGAAALGDIGMHFPPDEPEYRGISSIILLRKVTEILKEKGWRVLNVDATVIAERPRLREYIYGMRTNLAGAMGIDLGRVSVKASTSSGLGETGRGEGIAALAAVLITGGKE
jgi:2-C-methyl-D-erythritol 2,4-cyclodiphosphate synthase